MAANDDHILTIGNLDAMTEGFGSKFAAKSEATAEAAGLMSAADKAKLDGIEGEYAGDYSVTPSASGQTLGTARKVMASDVEVAPIPVSEASNDAGGKTISIA